MRFSIVFTSVFASTLVSAHGSGSIDQELARRAEFLKYSRSDVSHCAAKIKARGLEERAVKRRAETVEALRQKRGIKTRRDLESVLNTDHNQTAKGYDLDTPIAELFATNKSCVLTPEGESGPYYVAGEYIRTDLAEAEAGIPVHYDFQILDATTCEPISGAYYEIFNCNTTGVYSGTTNGGNGNTADVSVLDATWLRGIQPTDEDGVAQFDTLFPGHYGGRATHIHTILHANATARDNGTIFDLSASHIGQVFWDQSVRDQVELLEPYNANTKQVTLNKDDRVFAAEVENDNDPVFNYVLIGDTIEDGFLAWLTLGVDTTLRSTINPAAIYYEDGGVEQGNGGGPGGPGGPPPEAR
ncbi:Intradiol ring-cleavage dioxygenase [Truncatella angustata]|uniref:Intradiol ring-cleavage dioxygenase n=1 Tax=Truncatella angustata TaxID=152316 RepID=A0A9P8ZZZ5_9PEZI|nr:Intradiol ring-cleavage dioxygenase [Truncatella angustata]KAH6656539.1 Intradiol ring-cleavage dioxygenase [Truncatella angustata]KAH8194759.1 hypothetical protein TruAng_011084 [Truncatella angustata]